MRHDYVAEVEKGMKDGDEVVFPGESEQFPGYAPGDIVFTIKQLPHNTFERIGDNLYADLEITLQEALLGFSKAILHLDGRNVAIERNEVTQPMQTIIIKGEGMPIRDSRGEFGDLHVTLKVKLNKMSKEKIAELDKILLGEEKNGQ